jgi:adenylate kinase
MKLIFVTGIPQIDRKTIINLSLQRAGRKQDFSVIDFDEIESIHEGIGEIEDMESAKSVLSKFYGRIEKSLISELKRQKGDMAISGHLTFVTKHGYERAMPDDFFRSFKPDMIVLIEKTEDKIDQKIAEHQLINRYYAAIASAAAGSSLKIIKFRENRMMETVEELSAVMKS